MAEVEDLLSKVKSYDPQADLKLIRKAYAFAEVAHLGQKRLSGEETVQHVAEVADILTEIRADSATLAAALLHDVLEESNVDRKTLSDEFGEEVTELVEGLTVVRVAGGRAPGGEGRDWDTLRQLILASIQDPRVLGIRLADKIANLRTSPALPPERRRLSAQKVLDLWAPLAGILGLYHFKAELEDRAFAILESEKYRQIEERVAAESKRMSATVKQARQKIAKALAEQKISAEITGRTKHLYGVYRKLPKYEGKAHGRYSDVLGLRVVTKSVEDCYRILDLVRHFWPEVPELFDDYVAQPKPNGYQSIHVVFEVGEHQVEVQIRTAEMHQVAEYGLAAHSAYKEGKRPSRERADLVRSLVFWEKGQKLELFPDEVFVFTPQGDVKILPKGATPVDFAFAVHTRIGRECSGAKVNGKAVSLDYSLRTGEVVEIATTTGKKPSADWLRFVKTEHARSVVGKEAPRG